MGAASSFIGLGLSAMNMAASAQQSHQQQQAKNLAAEWNARLMETKAAEYDLKAEDALQRGESEASVHILNARKARSSTASSYAASGVDINSGSPVDVVSDMAAWQEYERQQIIANAERTAWGHRSEANYQRQSAAMSRATKESPGLAAAGTALSGASGLWKEYGSKL